MNYETIETYIDYLRKKDEHSIELKYITQMKFDVKKYLNELSEESYYEYSRCYFLLMLINRYMQNKKKYKENLLKSIELLDKINSNNKNYEAILYGYLSNYHTQYSDTNTSVQVYQIARDKFELSCDADELIQFYLRHIKLLMNKSCTEGEIQPYVENIHRTIKENNVKYIAMYYCDIAQIHLSVFDNTVGAIFYLSQSLDLSIKTSQVDLEIRNRIFLALSYTLLGNYMESVNYLKPILSDPRYEKINLVYKITAANNLMSNYLKLGLYNCAYECLEIIQSTYISNNLLNEVQLKMIIYMCKAEYYSLVEIDKIKEAVRYIKKSRLLYEKNKYKNIYRNIDVMIDKIEANIYYKLGNYEKSYKLHKAGLEKSLGKNINNLIIEFYKLLSMDCEQLNDFKGSIENLKQHMLLKEKWMKIQNDKYTKILLKEYDINEKEEKIDELNSLKDILVSKRNKDELTGLLNRRFLNEFISQNVSNDNKENEQVSILMIDIDYFKKYNDKYGHVKGDEILTQIGKLLNKIAYKHMAIRYGGEEFLVLLKDITHEETIEIANEILNKVDELNIEHETSPLNSKITVSIGIATGKQEKSGDYNKLVDDADKALYMAKKNGKNRYIHIKDMC